MGLGMPDYVDDEYEWDIDKSEATYALRGFDFAFASQLFDQDQRLERLDLRREYGEERNITWGIVEGVQITVVWTPRSHRKRIIAAFLSDDEDLREYEQAYGWSWTWPHRPVEDSSKDP
jgi:uncharacterized DUF497 family protein